MMASTTSVLVWIRPLAWPNVRSGCRSLSSIPPSFSFQARVQASSEADTPFWASDSGWANEKAMPDKSTQIIFFIRSLVYRSLTGNRVDGDEPPTVSLRLQSDAADGREKRG